MNASQFRSHLMQQFAANARTQSRPPIALFSLSGAASSSSSNGGGGGGGGGEEERPPRGSSRRRLRQRASSASVTAVTAISSRGLLPPTLSTIISSSSGHDASPPSTINSRLIQSSCSSSVAAKSSAASADEADSSSSIAAAAADHSRLTLTRRDTQSQAAQNFQQLIASRRTVTNFLPPSPSPHPSDEQFLRDAISRGVRCAIAAAAPHRKIIATTEPATTFHRIIMLSPSAASERLLDIAYEATLQRLLANKLSGAEACRSEATRKREKWSRVPAFLAVTTGGMEPQTTAVASAAAGNNAEDGDDTMYTELPHVPPKTMRQLEGYGAACASVQNLLLGLHAEGLGSKWATGPVIRTRAFRDLVRCREEDMVVGLIMIGRPKRLPGTRRTMREVDGDVLRDVDA